AAHAIASAAFGLHVHWLSIVPNTQARSPGGIYHFGGFFYATTSTDQPDPEEQDREITCDCSKIAPAALALELDGDAPKPRWKLVLHTYRRLRLLTDDLIQQGCA